MKNGFEVIDSHCHIYPEKIVEKAVHGTDNFYGVVSACYGTVSDLFVQGGKAGIDRFIVQSVATTPKQVHSINNFVAEQVEFSGGKLIGLGTLHQDSPDMISDVKNIVSLGLKGIKLHPEIQGFKIDEKRNYLMYELACKYKLPILMHTGDKRYDNSNPNRLTKVLKDFPDLTLIGAHFGGWSIYEQASLELCGFKNLYVDCSSSFYCLTDEQITEIINRYGCDKVLFGTDYPMWSPEKELDRFFSLSISDEGRRKILSENCKKVFNFE